MFKVIFDTSEAVKKLPKRRRDWEIQLRDDFIRAVNGKEFHCTNEKSLEERFAFISGSNLLSKPCCHDFVELESQKYGKRIEPIRMWGIPQGYVSFEKILNNIKKYSICRIHFNDFYDMRQSPCFAGCTMYIQLTAF